MPQSSVALSVNIVSNFSTSTCVRVCIFVFICMCVCVCLRGKTLFTVIFEFEAVSNGPFAKVIKFFTLELIAFIDSNKKINN